jgi:hypothetical protein
MNPLLQAILDGRTAEVRSIAAARPHLLGERSSSGRLPLEVARAKGRADLQVALLRAGASPLGEVPDFCALLGEYLAELSSSTFAAGWLDGLEFIVWDAVATGAPLGDPEHFRPLSDDEIADLLFLAGRCGGWVTENGRRVPPSEWHALYGSWKARGG